MKFCQDEMNFCQAQIHFVLAKIHFVLAKFHFVLANFTRLVKFEPVWPQLGCIQRLQVCSHGSSLQNIVFMGIYLGYALAHYADFYDMKHVLILGRCTSGRGGDILLDQAQKV